MQKSLPRPKLNILLIVCLLLIPPLVLVFLIANFGVDVPFFDEWEQAAFVIKTQTGGFTLADFWRQHNEHRIVFLRIIFIILAKLTNWNVFAELYTSLFFVVLTMLLWWRLLVLTVRSKLLPVLVGLSSVLIFSAVQAENWLWGFELPWFCLNFWVALALVALTEWQGKRLGYFLAMFATFVATYSLAGGMFMWGIILLGLLLNRKRWGWRAIVGWIGAATFSIGLYFYDYTAYKLGSDTFYFLKQPFQALGFIFAYLGAPIGSGGGLGWSIAFGISSTILFVAVSYWIWFRAYQRGLKAREAALPWLQVALFALVNAGITMIGRLSLGLEQALTSRYTTGATLFWLSLAALVTIAFHDLQAIIKPSRKIITNIGLGGLTAALAIGLLWANLYGWGLMSSINLSRSVGLTALYDYSVAPDELLSNLYANSQIPRLREAAWSLDQYDLGPFRSDAIAEFKRKSDRIFTNEFSSFIYPPNLMKITAGDSNSLRYNADSISFGHSGKNAINILVDGKDLNKQRTQNLVGSWNEQVLNIESGEAYYINIYWDTGKGLSEYERYTIYRIYDKNGEKDFRVPVPANVKAFRVDFYFTRSTPKTETIKIMVYDKR